MAVAYAFSDATQKRRSCGFLPPISLSTEMIDNSFISVMIFCHVSMSSFFNWWSHPFSWIHKFWRKLIIFIVVGVKYPSGSNNEAIVVRTCLWSVSVSHYSPKTFVMVSFMRSCPAIFLYSSGELEFQSPKFTDISRNNFFAFECSCSASSLFAPVIRLST